MNINRLIWLACRQVQNGASLRHESTRYFVLAKALEIIQEDAASRYCSRDNESVATTYVCAGSSSLSPSITADTYGRYMHI